jgi:hypothetical protein
MKVGADRQDPKFPNPPQLQPTSLLETARSAGLVVFGSVVLTTREAATLLSVVVHLPRCRSEFSTASGGGVRSGLQA